MKQNGAIFLDPPIEVERFSWSMGDWRHGRLFGDDDAATKTRKKTGEQEPAGTGQSATRPESDSEGGNKPQPESEARSR